MATSKIKRSLWKNYLNTTPEKSGSATWSLMNLGITSQTMAYNPKTTTEIYVGEDNARTSTDSYQISMDTPMTCFKGDAVFEYIDKLRKARATEGECITQLLSVNAYDGSDGTYSAEKSECNIAITNFGGDAGNPISIEFTIGINGDPEIGTATISEEGEVTFQAA